MRADRLGIVALAAVTLLRLIVAAVAPLSPDEAYYRVWSRALAPGYLDHPPMVALWIRAGTLLAGETTLGVRLLAPLAAALGSLLLARAAGDLILRPGAGLRAAALLNATLLFGAGSVTMTPDTPLLFFWVLAVWALARLLATGNGVWWLMAGLAAGLAVTAKYTALLLPVGIGLWLLATQAGRFWITRPWPWLGLAVAGLAAAPVVGWNAAHGWASFIKQGGRAGDFDPASAPRYLAELLGGQIGLATPLIFLLCTAGVVAACRRARHEPAAALLAALTLPAVALFVTHAIGDRVQANWPSILYPAAAIAAASLAARWQRLVVPAVALGAAMTLLVYLQAIAAPLALPHGLDPTLARLGGWDAFTAAVAARAHDTGAAYIAGDSYAEAAELAWWSPPGVVVIGAAPRWAFFDLPDAGSVIAGRTGLLMQSARRVAPPDPAPWVSVESLGEITRARDGVAAERYRLYRVIGRPGAIAVILPGPRGER